MKSDLQKINLIETCSRQSKFNKETIEAFIKNYLADKDYISFCMEFLVSFRDNVDEDFRLADESIIYPPQESLKNSKSLTEVIPIRLSHDIDISPMLVEDKGVIYLRLIEDYHSVDLNIPLYLLTRLTFYMNGGGVHQYTITNTPPIAVDYQTDEVLRMDTMSELLNYRPQNALQVH